MKIMKMTHSFIGKHLTLLPLAAYFVIPVVGIILYWDFVIFGEIKEKQNVVALKCCYI